jgi:hypothetical protein
LLPYSGSRLQLPQLYTSISKSVAKRKLAPATVKPSEEVAVKLREELAVKLREEFAVELREELAVELREELAVELRKEADTEAQPTGIDTKLDTSGR